MFTVLRPRDVVHRFVIARSLSIVDKAFTRREVALRLSFAICLLVDAMDCKSPSGVCQVVATSIEYVALGRHCDAMPAFMH